MKQILTYSNFNVDGLNINLFTAGHQGLIFTQARFSGLTLAQTAPNSGGSMPMSGDLIGQGLGFGHSLVASGTGSITVTMYGELQEYYRIINSSQLEVIVGYPVPFQTNGVISGYTTVVGEATWLPQGVYTGYTFSVNANNEVLYT